MAKFRHHKYTWQKPFGSVRHNWELVGPKGGIHFHVSIAGDGSWGPSCGLEFHHTEATGYRCDEAPDHINCPLTGGRCWHDGTSLYASETVWPMVEPYVRGGEHDMVFRVLESEYDDRFSQFDANPGQEAA